jgi:hypothetical protein
MYRYEGIYPIGDSDPKNMPVRQLEPAVRWYESNMGFRIKSRAETPHPSATLARETIELVLAQNGGDPEQASCYLAVSDVDAAYRDLAERQLDISNRRVDEHEGKRYDVFFVRAPDGLCFCIGQRVADA